MQQQTQTIAAAFPGATQPDRMRRLTNSWHEVDCSVRWSGHLLPLQVFLCLPDGSLPQVALHSTPAMLWAFSLGTADRILALLTMIEQVWQVTECMGPQLIWGTIPNLGTCCTKCTEIRLSEFLENGAAEMSQGWVGKRTPGLCHYVHQAGGHAGLQKCLLSKKTLFLETQHSGMLCVSVKHLKCANSKGNLQSSDLSTGIGASCAS